MDGPSVVGAGGAATSPISPMSARHDPSASGGLLLKRKRSDSSPASIGEDEGHHDLHDHHEKKRQPGVKRACNECRQQKLRCDVVQDPFSSCSRCNRLKLECKIESNFKRVGKRSKHAEMEKELEYLRRQNEKARQRGYIPDEEDEIHSQLQSPIANSTYGHTRHPSLMGSDDVVTSLINLKQGGGFAIRYHELDGIRLSDDTVSRLFQEFFTCYHPYLPFLNPSQTYEQYKQQNELLFWTIIAVASRRYSRDTSLLERLTVPYNQLLWKTVGDVPSSYYAVKALCLVCTWPLPTSTTTSDPTHILCGVMMKSATGIGLHRPSHSQDFSRVSVDLDVDQLHDRVITWAVCNIVAQSIGTGYGQPASTLYDWTLAVRPGDLGPFTLHQELEARLQIERFCDKVSKEMYSNAMDPRGVAGDEHRAMLMRVYRRDFSELQALVQSQTVSPIVKLHLKAAQLHLRLAGFFDSPSTPGYIDDLMGLWRATTAFLDTFIETEPLSPGSNISHMLKYCTNYIQQMLVAAGFALLKLLNSFFAKSVDFNRGRRLFRMTIQAIRTTSVVPNDLQGKLAELMYQMGKNSIGFGGQEEPSSIKQETDTDPPVPPDDSLQLKVRCRHSMSLVFDSIWRWREEYQAKGRGSLDGLKYPTHHDSGNDSGTSNTPMDTTLIPPSHGLHTNLLGGANGALTPGTMAAVSSAMLGPVMAPGYPDANYDLWNSDHWALDTLLNFDYSAFPQMEG